MANDKNNDYEYSCDKEGQREEIFSVSKSVVGVVAFSQYPEQSEIDRNEKGNQHTDFMDYKDIFIVHESFESIDFLDSDGHKTIDIGAYRHSSSPPSP